MKYLSKFQMIILFICILCLVGCDSTSTTINDNKKNEALLDNLEYLINYSDNIYMDSNMENKGYIKLEYNDYLLYKLSNVSINDTYCIDSTSKLSSIDIGNVTLQKELKNKYTTSFFNTKVLLLTSYKMKSSNSIMTRMYYSKNDFCFVYDSCEGNTQENCYLVEIDLSNFIMFKKLNYDIQYSSDLFALNYNHFTTMEEEKNESFVSDMTHYLVSSNNSFIITDYNQKETIITNEEKIKTFMNSWQLFGIKNCNKETTNTLLFKVSYDYFDHYLYTNNYIEVYTDNEFLYAGYASIGNPYFLLLFVLNENATSYHFTNQMTNMLLNAYNQNIITSSMMDDLIPIILKINDLDLTSDFTALSTLEQLEMIVSYSDVFSKKETTLLKNLITIYKKVFKNYLTESLHFDIYYNLVINEIDTNYAIINTDYINIKYGQDITIPFEQKTGYLYCGAYDPYGTLYTDFNYDFYGDLVLTKHYTESLNYEIVGIDNDVVISKYKGKEQTVFAPIICSQGKKITKIASNAFNGNTTITNLSIGNEKIGDTAFKNCTNLINIDIQNSVKEIGTNVFEGCTKLENVTLHNGVEKLAPYLFKNCSSLWTIYIPASLNDLSDHVFEGCDIETFEVSINNEKYYAANNCIMEGTTLYYGCKNSSIPDGTVFIREFAFYGVIGLEKIYIPSCVVHIDTSAFEGCSGLKEAYISQSVMWNAKNAFNTGTNTIINCEYYQKMNGWVALWTTGTTVNWSVPQPE